MTNVTRQVRLTVSAGDTGAGTGQQLVSMSDLSLVCLILVSQNARLTASSAQGDSRTVQITGDFPAGRDRLLSFLGELDTKALFTLFILGEETATLAEQLARISEIFKPESVTLQVRETLSPTARASDAVAQESWQQTSDEWAQQLLAGITNIGSVIEKYLSEFEHLKAVDNTRLMWQKLGLYSLNNGCRALLLPLDQNRQKQAFTNREIPPRPIAVTAICILQIIMSVTYGALFTAATIGDVTGRNLFSLALTIAMAIIAVRLLCGSENARSAFVVCTVLAVVLNVINIIRGASLATNLSSIAVSIAYIVFLHLPQANRFFDAVYTQSKKSPQNAGPLNYMPAKLMSRWSWNGILIKLLSATLVAALAASGVLTWKMIHANDYVTAPPTTAPTGPRTFNPSPQESPTTAWPVWSQQDTQGFKSVLDSGTAGTVVVQRPNGSTWVGLSATTAVPLWQVDFPCSATCDSQAAGGYLVLLDPGVHMSSFNTHNGKQLSDTAGSRCNDSIVALVGEIVVTRNDTTFCARSVSDLTTVLWEAPVIPYYRDEADTTLITAAGKYINTSAGVIEIATGKAASFGQDTNGEAGQGDSVYYFGADDDHMVRLSCKVVGQYPVYSTGCSFERWDTHNNRATSAAIQPNTSGEWFRFIFGTGDIFFVQTEADSDIGNVYDLIAYSWSTNQELWRVSLTLQSSTSLVLDKVVAVQQRYDELTIINKVNGQTIWANDECSQTCAIAGNTLYVLRDGVVQSYDLRSSLLVPNRNIPVPDEKVSSLQTAGDALIIEKPDSSNSNPYRSNFWLLRQ